MNIVHMIYELFRFRIAFYFACILPKQRSQKNLEKLIINASKFTISSLSKDLSGLYPVHVQRAQEALERSQAAYRDRSISEDDKILIYQDLIDACHSLRIVSASAKNITP